MWFSVILTLNITTLYAGEGQYSLTAYTVVPNTQKFSTCVAWFFGNTNHISLALFSEFNRI